MVIVFFPSQNAFSTFTRRCINNIVRLKKKTSSATIIMAMTTYLSKNVNEKKKNYFFLFTINLMYTRLIDWLFDRLIILYRWCFILIEIYFIFIRKFTNHHTGTIIRGLSTIFFSNRWLFIWYKSFFFFWWCWNLSRWFVMTFSFEIIYDFVCVCVCV